MIRLRVEDAEAVRSIEVDLDYLTVGRATGCTLPLKDPEVGRFHASLERNGSTLRMTTSGRGGGTWVNGKPVADEAEVRVGDRITFGKTHVTLDAILPGKRIAAPDLPPPPPLPPDSALVGPGAEKPWTVPRREEPGTAPRQKEPGAVPGGTPPSPAAPGNASIGFSTEMLRAPGSTGEEEARALRRILDINKRLAREADEDRLLDLVLEAAADLTGAERGLVLLRGAEEGKVRIRRDRGGAAADRDQWTAAARRVLATGRPLRLEGDGGAHRALLCVPLRGEAGVTGLLYLDRRIGGFDARAAALLEALADQGSLALSTRARTAELADTSRRLEEALRDRTLELQTAKVEAARARSELQLKFKYDRIVGRSAPMRTLLGLVDKVTESAVPVLIEGESGTGKELVARAVHFNGPRSSRPFVVENCAAVPDALVENELFGHEKGAFTGADRAEDGIFERADGGTLFLDEVGDMSFDMQKKLLRVLQEGEVRRVGGKAVLRVDVRILSATNRDLARLVKEGKFREDLFYRLCVVRVRIPPLRERREDVPLLAARFLDRITEESGGEAPRLEAGALDALTAYPWPGNVRELENEIRRAVTLCGGAITRDVLSPHVRDAGAAGGAGPAPVPVPRDGQAPTLRAAVEDLERVMLLSVLKDTGGNKTHAARILGLSRLGLRKKMGRYGMDG